jgi:hypothetical protein
MKVLSIPSSGALSNLVAYKSPFGQVYRARVVPRNTPSAARDFMRGVFGHHSQVYSRGLTQAQRDRWCYAGGQVMSHPRLGSGPLSGQQLHERINCVLSRVGRANVAEPPAPVVLGPNPARELVITNDAVGVRLFLRVAEEWAGGETRLPGEDLMVFGQAPCSAGRSKRRNVSYLGLLGPAVGGLAEITEMYKARFGEPRAGRKVFIVTRQQKDGWEGPRVEVSAIVPEEAEGLHELNGLHGLQEVAGEGGGLGAAGRASTGEKSQKVLMHKGTTRGVKGTQTVPGSRFAGGAEAQEADEAGDPKPESRGRPEIRNVEGGG